MSLNIRPPQPRADVHPSSSDIYPASANHGSIYNLDPLNIGLLRRTKPGTRPGEKIEALIVFFSPQSGPGAQQAGLGVTIVH